ncbi:MULTISPECIES: hypothetical protein [unclassified Polaromonas]|uniref:hypothetical protein n=1 Tax=unclassified Polaromonas TaxID=2638319 RepID=UPI00129D9A8C|nr:MULTISPECIES: hypothetical protein [unclassified Polaromonas]QGJ19853.1 hypothetical protein F7R28_16630 [Polaromonas sp. Pch-P]
MDVDAEIRNAIEVGERQGLASLAGMRQQVFAISEAEVYCDKDGIDALVHRYGFSTMHIFAEAYRAIGAADIASALLELHAAGTPSRKLMSRANTLITRREGYSYENLETLVRRST